MTTTGSIFELVAKALGLIGDGPPAPLPRALAAAADWLDEPQVTLQDVARHVEEAPADDATRLMLHHRLAVWDGAAASHWTGGTFPQTQARREVVYSQLQVDEIKEILQRKFPPHVVEFPEFTISDHYKPWYDEKAAEATGFYWPRYRGYLTSVEHWPPPSSAALQRATSAVMKRVAQPSRPDIYPSRGLVVGFVQSGKTANFTGVIARAVDAGYRLIIILAGMTDLLREQTQRRLDKQLLGKEILLGLAGAADEYRGARDWGRFISYGSKPSHLGASDWVRLTNLNSDYRRLGKGPGLAALEFEWADKTKPLFDPANLGSMRTRLAVVKKNSAPLKALAADLLRVQESGMPVADIPTLIIDDESDQASLNTKKPTKDDIDKRSKINEKIVELLDILKRAQYVGYTATPAANVLTDPNDKVNIFPRHYITSLERPLGYMGAADYHDFGEARAGYESNERAYVRSVYGDNSDRDNLRKALDSYLIAGSIKLFRQEQGEEINCRHHTMLVHTSQLQSNHSAMAKLLNDLLDNGGYRDGSADARLKTLLEEDFRPVSQVRASDLAFPASYLECRPYIGQCLDRLELGPNRVLIVNGEKQNEPLSPDFDRDDVWKVIVGGTKLSRGYTVEGLTVSYYRRAAGTADTLMQMGRWFGFRRGYADLMRLFIGRAEGKRAFDLYQAFEAICQDELEFRKELLRYALPDDGTEPVTPMRVPPLISQHMPDLPVVPSNKRWNAKIVSQNFGGRGIAPTMAPKSAKSVSDNQNLVRALMLPVELQSAILGLTDDSFAALCGFCGPSEMIDFLKAYNWSKSNVLERQLGFFEGKQGDPQIRQWLIVWPQLAKAGALGTWKLAKGREVTVIERYRNIQSGRFGVYTTPAHVNAARAIVLGADIQNSTADTQKFRKRENIGVALFYAVKAKGERNESIGFYLLPPENSIKEKIKWGVEVAEAEDEPIVDDLGK